MRRESLKLLHDMRDAAATISGFVVGKTSDEYMNDLQLRMAVERGFEIVGEALSQLRKIDAPTAERITDWQAIIGFRNVLIHGYGVIDHAKTWDILRKEVPTLLRELDELLS